MCPSSSPLSLLLLLPLIFLLPISISGHSPPNNANANEPSNNIYCEPVRHETTGWCGNCEHQPSCQRPWPSLAELLLKGDQRPNCTCHWVCVCWKGYIRQSEEHGAPCILPEECGKEGGEGGEEDRRK